MAGFSNDRLSNQSGANGADVSLPASTTTTVFTTNTLNTGVYLVTMSALVNSPTSGASVELQARLGTALGSLAGETAAQSVLGAANGYATLSLSFIATVTTPGTLTLVANPSAAATAHYNTNVNLWAGTTGWSVVKIG